MIKIKLAELLANYKVKTELYFINKENRDNRIKELEEAGEIVEVLKQGDYITP